MKNKSKWKQGSCPACANIIVIDNFMHPSLENNVVCEVCTKVTEIWLLRDKIEK